MKIIKSAQSGSLESGDMLVTVQPSDSDIMIELDSPVLVTFGDLIRQEIMSTIEKLGIKNVHLKAVDRGALGYTVRARVETALRRASGDELGG